MKKLTVLDGFQDTNKNDKMSKLKCEVIGHLGQDAQLNENNGRKVLNFTVAHSVKFKNSEGEEKTRTTWVNCAYWNDRVEKLVSYMKKGTLVAVEGEPYTRTYVNREGITLASFDLNVKMVNLLSAAKSDDDSVAYFNDQQQD